MSAPRIKWKNLEKEKQLWILFLGGCLLCGLFFVPRAFLGFNTADEMYYIGTAERIFRGERILIDEWNPTQQLCSFLAYPFYWGLRVMLGSTEGIVMGFRLLTLGFHFLAVLLCFWKLKKKGMGAVLAALLFWIYAPYGFLALSYNTIETTMFPLLLICLLSKDHHHPWEYGIYGLMLAAVVLANPFALALYGIYGLACLGMSLWGRSRKSEIPELLQLKSFLWISLGAACLAALFAAFVLSRGSLQEIMDNLPHILSDSEHEQGSGVYLKKTKRYFHLCYKNYKYMFQGLGMVYLIALLDRKRYSHSVVYLGLGALFTVPYLIYYGFFFDHFATNYQMLPLAFLGLLAYVLTRQRDKKIFYIWFLPCLLFTMIVQYATNTGIVAISSAYSGCTVAAVIFLWDCMQEIWAGEHGALRKRVASLLVLGILAVQFAGTLFLRLTFVAGDERAWHLDTRMNRGPLKGVYTNEGSAGEYEQVLSELDTLALTKEDQLLVVGVGPWIYLYTDAGCGSYSTWQVHAESTQLFDYYELHPDKFPTVIYMLHWSEAFLESPLAEPFRERGYELIKLERGVVMQAPNRRIEG